MCLLQHLSGGTKKSWADLPLRNVLPGIKSVGGFHNAAWVPVSSSINCKKWSHANKTLLRHLQTWAWFWIPPPASTQLYFFSSPITMTLAVILQACTWESLHRYCLHLQIHTGPLLRDFAKARGVWGAETPDTWVHQAGPQLWAGRAESGCWRWELLQWLCGNAY